LGADKFDIIVVLYPSIRGLPFKRETTYVYVRFITGIVNKYIAFLNKNRYFSISYPTSEDDSLHKNGTNLCGKKIADSPSHPII
jgi:hypothetical protein